MQFRSLPVAVLVFGTAAAFGQAQPGNVPEPRMQRFISHFDLAIGATGEFNGSVKGDVKNSVSTTDATLKQSASNTIGVLVSIRGQKSAYVGGEFNYRYARYTQQFNFTNSQTSSFQAQNTANEYTLGYVAKPPHPILGMQPFVGGGAGSIEFKPTHNGGDNLPLQARAAYYYHVGLEKMVSDHFGFRAGFRQVFYKAPDFGQNYLTINKQTSSLEPTVGFFLHF